MSTPKRTHGEPVPFHVLHDLSDVPPVPCEFKVGDRVIFTNDAGLKFAEAVRAFSKEIKPHNWGRFVYVFPDDDAWWFPVRPESLKRATP